MLMDQAESKTQDDGVNRQCNQGKNSLTDDKSFP